MTNEKASVNLVILYSISLLTLVIAMMSVSILVFSCPLSEQIPL